MQNVSFAQQKQDDDVSGDQRPVRERDVGDSLIENLAELPGKICMPGEPEIIALEREN